MHPSILLILLLSIGVASGAPQEGSAKAEVIKHVTAVVKAINKGDKEEIYKLFKIFPQDKEKIVSFLQKFKSHNLRVPSAKYTNKGQNIEAELVFVPRKGGNNISATWFLEKSSESPTGWKTQEVRMSTGKSIGKRSPDWETAACASEPLICAIMTKKKESQ